MNIASFNLIFLESRAIGVTTTLKCKAQDSKMVFFGIFLAGLGKVLSPCAFYRDCG